MLTDPPDAGPIHEPLALLERAFIAEYLEARGYDPVALRQRGDAGAAALLREASSYASLKLTEVESRAQFLHDIHGRGPGTA